LPSAIFVVDAKHEKIAISEAKCLGIPTFGIVDTNTDPNVVDFAIPANDDSIKTIQLILNYISSSLYEILGHKQDDSSQDEKSNSVSDQKDGLIEVAADK
jgi:small subunit ribosomal protein S2